MPYTVRIAHQKKSFIVSEDETILDAALRQNFDIAHSCCKGICGSCEGQIIEGNIHYDATDHLVLDEQERVKGRALLCSAKADSDLLIDVPGINIPVTSSAATYEYALVNLERISKDVYQALFYPQAMPLHYLAGQYVEVYLPGQEVKPFSIANAPNEKDILELYIRCQEDNAYAKTLIAHLESTQALTFKGPFGRCFYHPKPAMPMILLAVGTGFAPMKAILEQAFKAPLTHEVSLFWAGKSPEDIYYLELTSRWEKKLPNFRCVPILSSESRDPQWPGVYGNILDLVLEYAPNLANHHIYFGGPMQLTFDGLERFVQHGAQTCYMYSDVFDLI